ncbi:MAG: DPP IV N-terminal domain-containing protein [Pseudomonadota bacterium]
MSAQTLQVQRLFADPPLTAAVPQRVTLIDHGDQTTLLFLLERPGKRAELELWRADGDAAAVPWLSAEALDDALLAPATAENEAERAARERLRQFAGGISAFAQRGNAAELLVPYQGQAFRVSLVDRAIERVLTPTQRLNELRCSPSGRWLSYVQDGNLHLHDIDSGNERAITGHDSPTLSSGLADFVAAEEMHRFEGYWWDPRERFLAFQQTDEAPIPIAYRHDIQADRIDVIEQRYPFAGGPNAAVALLLYELATQTVRRIPWQAEPDDYLARVNWLHGELWLQVQSRDQKCLRVLRIDPQTLRQREVFRETAATWINLHDNLLAARPGEFLWTSERDGYPRAYRGSTADGSLEVLTPEGVQVNRLLRWHEDRLWFEGWDDTPTESHLFELSLSAPAPQALQRKSPTGACHSAAVAATGAHVALVSSALDAAPGITWGSIAEPESRVALASTLWPEHPYREYLDAHCTPQLGTLETADGTRLHYRLTRPAGASAATPVPALVSVYGGPGAQRVRNEWAPLQLQLLVGAGYAVLELDNRGSHGRGHAFEAPIHEALGTVEVEDQCLGAQFLQSQPWVDGERLGVFGHSYGGYMTLRCLLAAPALFKAGVSTAPVTDWRLYDTHYTERYLGMPDTDPDRYPAAGVLDSAGALTRPLLLVHGMADDNVLFGNTTALLAVLQQANVPFELMTYPGSKHALQEPHVAVHRFEALLDFFERHLKA